MIYRLNFSKRQKFFTATIIVVLAMLLIRTELVSFIAWRFRVMGFSFVSLIAILASIKDEDFSGVEWITLPILPTLFAIAGSLVFPLLPNEISQFVFWFLDTDTGIVVAGAMKFVYLSLFAIGFYAILLTENIFNIGGLKSIQLTRVARSIGLFSTLTTTFLLNLVIYSLHLTSFSNFGLVFLFSFPLILQSIWSFNLEANLSREVITISFVLALVMAQACWVLSYYPITIFAFAIFLTALMYEMISLVQFYLSERITLYLIKEAIFVIAIFLILTISSASWSG